MTIAIAPADDDPLVRVVKGEPDDAELAALTAVLLARAVADQSRTEGDARFPARWRPAGYRSPLSWSRRA
ncbi:acyl-CoA carboxylase epsilon subunit [Streptomyces mirabilis]|uniref:acyl-CoA carboxylase epsilon subunit n=1 Tax=Streptomyces mirabilis TaxID=68239 RepID=UPI0036E6DCA2